MPYFEGWRNGRPTFTEVPIKVHWKGWSSDTYTLRRQGWQAFVHEGMCRDAYAKEIRLALKHPENDIMISGRAEIGMEHLYHGPQGLVELLYHGGVEMQEYRGGSVCRYYEIKAEDWRALSSMRPCDGFARVLSYETKRFDELELFKYTETSKEIIIPYQSVDECLNRILQLQFPERKKFEPGEVQKPVIQAKIYTLAA